MKFKPLLVSSVFAALFALVGGFLTKLDEWYYSLKQPFWKPPDLAFGPVWTIIFILCAMSAATCYEKAKEDRNYQIKTINVFIFNGILNSTWSFFYFYLKRPDVALLEVVFLWGSIIILILHAKKVSNLSAILLIPYLSWVSLAGVLNYQTVILNSLN